MMGREIFTAPDNVLQLSRVLRVALFLLVNWCAAYPAWHFAGRLLPNAPRSERAFAAAALFFALIVAIAAAAGFAGHVSPAVFAGAAFAAALAAFADSRISSRGQAGTACAPGPKPLLMGRLPLPVVVFATFAAVAFFFMFLWSVVSPPPPGGDGFIYHLYFPATWIQQGRIGYVALPYGAQAATYYPLNTELFYLWLLLPLHEDFMANTAQLFALAAAAAGVYCLARRIGAGQPAAHAGACAALLLPGFVQQAGVARVDIFFSLWMLGAVYFLLRWHESARTAHLLLFGICWGLFAGTKSLAIPYSLCIAAPFVLIAARRGMKTFIGSAVLVAALCAAFGGFWYLRNLAATGNPFYPLEFAVAGHTVFGGAYGREAMRVFHVSGPAELLRIANLFLAKGPALWLALCGLVSLVFFAAKPSAAEGQGQHTRPHTGAAPRFYVLLLPLLILALFWFVNPHNNLTNGRFLFPAFIFACVYPAVATGRSGGAVAAVLLWLAPVAFIAGTLQPGSDHLARMAADIASAMSGDGNGLLAPARVALWLCAAAFVLAALAAVMRKSKAGAAALLFTGCLVLAAGILFAWNYNTKYKYDWIARAGAAGRAWKMFDERTPRPTVVANIGNERAYPLFGTGLRHRVVMINTDGRDGTQFHDYEHEARQRGEAWDKTIERPQIHRAHADPEKWIAALKRGKVELLFCSDLEPIAWQFMSHTPDGFPIEVQWIRERPGMFRKMYEVRRAPGEAGDTGAVVVYAFSP